MSIETIFEQIEQERSKQDEEWGGPQHDDKHNLFDWAKFIGDHLDRAKRAKTSDEKRYQLIRVAALAVAAIETHDRTHV